MHVKDDFMVGLPEEPREKPIYWATPELTEQPHVRAAAPSCGPGAKVVPPAAPRAR